MSKAKAESTIKARIKNRIKNRTKDSTGKKAPKAKGEAPIQMDTLVEEGDLIAFEHTGETLKVTKIEGNTIVFEKSP